jgi:hypothetical protein
MYSRTLAGRFPGPYSFNTPTNSFEKIDRSPFMLQEQILRQSNDHYPQAALGATVSVGISTP